MVIHVLQKEVKQMEEKYYWYMEEERKRKQPNHITPWVGLIGFCFLPWEMEKHGEILSSKGTSSDLYF